jgi:DNA recombination protein RmuC
LSETSLKLGSSLIEAEGRTAESLSKLYERLVRIDAAGQSLDDLSKEVVSLQQVLSDKQTRGAFGQMRMEAILEDGLPRNAFELQATLSNGKRPDALIRLPSAPAPLAVDAKFPLEGFEALRTAATAEARTQALARFRDSVSRHVDDIAGKYLIPGETQDMALMFVPSEAVYAELHERLPELVQRAFRARVVIVSPNMLMPAVQTMQAIFKDVRMREQASLIQREVGHLMADVMRLVERAQDLDKHFTLAAKDVEKLLTSAERIGQRAKRIDTVELKEEAEDRPAGPRLAAGE